MHFAYTTAPDRGQLNRLLTDLAQALQARGCLLCGAVQDDSGNGMTLHILPDGPALDISQDLGPGAEGCCLNPGALEHAVVQAATRLGPTTACVIVNKFGKQEAEGRGFRDLIAEALSRDIPVIVGVAPPNQPAFAAFSDGCAQALPPDPAALLDWALTATDKQDA